MPCPPVKQLVSAVETESVDPRISPHVETCQACQAILRTLRDESQSLTISVRSLWISERISCPHKDILLAYVNGGLGAEEREYLGFHLGEIECPHCQSVVTELEDLVAEGSPERVKRALDDSMRRSAIALDQLRRD